MDLATATAARIAAEAAFDADPSDANLKTLSITSQAEMDAYLEGFDRRHGNTAKALEQAQRSYPEATDVEAAHADGAVEVIGYTFKVSATAYGWITAAGRVAPCLETDRRSARRSLIGAHNFDRRNNAPAATEEPAAPAPAVQLPKNTPAWFTDLLDQGLTMDPADFEAAAYSGYVSAGIADTDGWFIPMDREAFAHGFRKDPIGCLYWNNDARHKLAPYAMAYATSLLATAAARTAELAA